MPGRRAGPDRPGGVAARHQRAAVERRGPCVRRRCPRWCWASPRRASRGRGRCGSRRVRAAAGEFPDCRCGRTTTGRNSASTGPRCSKSSTDARRCVGERASAVHTGVGRRYRQGRPLQQRERSGATIAGLTGGVFQNRLLTELAAAGLERHGFRVLLPEPGPVQRRRPRLWTGRRTPRPPPGRLPPMLWFERPFLAVLRREYSGAMRLDEDDSAEVMPDSAGEALPAVRAHPVLRGALPVLLVPPRALQRATEPRATSRRCAREIRLYHGEGLPFRRRLRRRRHSDGGARTSCSRRWR